MTTPEGGMMANAHSVSFFQLQTDGDVAAEDALQEICYTAEVLAKMSLTATIDIAATGENIFLGVTVCVLPDKWAVAASCITLLQEQVKRLISEEPQCRFACTAHKSRSASPLATVETNGQGGCPVTQAAPSIVP